MKNGQRGNVMNIEKKNTKNTSSNTNVAGKIVIPQRLLKGKKTAATTLKLEQISKPDMPKPIVDVLEGALILALNKANSGKVIDIRWEKPVDNNEIDWLVDDDKLVNIIHEHGFELVGFEPMSDGMGYDVLVSRDGETYNLWITAETFCRIINTGLTTRVVKYGPFGSTVESSVDLTLEEAEELGRAITKLYEYGGEASSCTELRIEADKSICGYNVFGALKGRWDPLNVNKK